MKKWSRLTPNARQHPDVLAQGGPFYPKLPSASAAIHDTPLPFNACCLTPLLSRRYIVYGIVTCKTLCIEKLLLLSESHTQTISLSSGTPNVVLWLPRLE